jgi:hypothetical protein
VKQVSQKVKQASVAPFVEQGLPVAFLRNPATDRDEIARAFAAERRTASGLVGALSSVEPSPSFEHRATHMLRRTKPCQVLTSTSFFIVLDPDETIALLQALQPLLLHLTRPFPPFQSHLNAQRLLHRQLEINWTDLPNGFAGS